MKRIIRSPGSYIQGNGELNHLAEYYKELGSSGAYLIIDSFICSTYMDSIESSFLKHSVPFESSVFGGQCCQKEIDRHISQIGSADAVFGIGGGKTLDTAKAVAFSIHRPVILVPTAASSDAPCSRLAAIYTESGVFDHYLPLTSNPDMIIMDTAVIARAPARFLMAGIGDALSTYYEAAACERSCAVTSAGGRTSPTAMALARLCLDTLLSDGLKAKAAAVCQVSTPALENIVEANTYLSGVAFESGGLAAAHAIHNGLTLLPETHRLLHGELVAFCTIVQLILENRPLEEIKTILSFCRACGLPTRLSDLGLEHADDSRLMEASAASCSGSMANMPFPVTPADVLAALKAADRVNRELC